MIRVAIAFAISMGLSSCGISYLGSSASDDITIRDSASLERDTGKLIVRAPELPGAEEYVEYKLYFEREGKRPIEIIPGEEKHLLPGRGKLYITSEAFVAEGSYAYPLPDTSFGDYEIGEGYTYFYLPVEITATKVSEIRLGALKISMGMVPMEFDPGLIGRNEVAVTVSQGGEDPIVSYGDASREGHIYPRVWYGHGRDLDCVWHGNRRKLTIPVPAEQTLKFSVYAGPVVETRVRLNPGEFREVDVAPIDGHLEELVVLQPEDGAQLPQADMRAQMFNGVVEHLSADIHGQHIPIRMLQWLRGRPDYDPAEDGVAAHSEVYVPLIRAQPSVFNEELRILYGPNQKTDIGILVNGFLHTVTAAERARGFVQLHRLDINHPIEVDPDAGEDDVEGATYRIEKYTAGEWLPPHMVYRSYPTGTSMLLAPGSYRVHLRYTLSTGESKNVTVDREY